MLRALQTCECGLAVLADVVLLNPRLVQASIYPCPAICRYVDLHEIVRWRIFGTTAGLGDVKLISFYLEMVLSF